MAFASRLRRDDGFSLIEQVIAIAVILTGTLGTLTLLDRANAQTSSAKARQTANALLRDIAETSQGIAYTQLTGTGIKPALQSAGFADEVPVTGSTWEIKRNGITYTMAVSACTVDDPRDGQGPHTADFCTDSPSGTGDSNPDDYRRVKITATPPNGLGEAITQTTVVGSNRITNPGGTGPGGGTATSNDIKELKITAPTLYSGQVAPCNSSSSCTFPTATSTSVSPKSVTFQANTAYTAQKVKFTVDGRPMVTISGPATSFNWTWNLPDNQPDGSYVVAAQIFDDAGTTAISSPAPLVVTINRYIPDHNAFAPTAAGRNPLWGNLPEIETYPTPDTTARVDRDVTGFVAMRYVNGVANGVACQTFTPTLRGCQDTNPPNCCSASVTYRITPTGSNPDGSQQTGGITAASRNVNLPNTRPLEPENVTVTRNGTRVTITWTNPVGTTPNGSGDPDAGDCIDFFRVYRRDLNGTTWEYADRVDRTIYGNAVAPCGGAGEFTNSIVLNELNANTKRYRVTAVDTNLAESPREQVTG